MFNLTLQAARRGMVKCKAFFDKHYLLANVGVYGGLYCLGDITCQTISHANTELSHDWQRTKRMTVVGCTVLPIMNTYFYRVLDRIIIGSSPRIVLLKVIIDTFAWGPVCFSAFLCGKFKGIAFIAWHIKADMLHVTILNDNLDRNRLPNQSNAQRHFRFALRIVVQNLPAPCNISLKTDGNYAMFRHEYTS